MTLEIWTPIFVFWIISFFYIGSNLVIALNVGGGGELAEFFSTKFVKLKIRWAMFVYNLIVSSFTIYLEVQKYIYHSKKGYFSNAQCFFCIMEY